MAAEIHPAVVFDSAVLANLHRLSCTANWDEPWSQQSFAGILATPGAIGLLAAQDGEPIGFALGRIAADEGEVLLIATRPEQRRQGIARALLTALLEKLAATGAARVFLEVAEPNAAALGLYRSAGFDTVGRRPNYYRSTDGRHGDSAIDAVLLRRAF